MDFSTERLLVIDNGSYECRVGWSDAELPILRFRNVLTKPRKERKKDNNSKDTTEFAANAVIQVGNDITNIEAVRAQLKSPFDRNVITNWNHMEQILDYTFVNVGCNGQDHIAYPIVMTEPLANPNICRLQMNELLYECYGVPAVSHGIDALFSWQNYQKQKQISNALIISFGYTTTHVIPILDGKMQMQHVRRLNVGGYHVITFLYRLMQMKYPVHLNAITISRIELLVHQQCYIAVDYQNELMKWADGDYYDKNVTKIQLPYNAVAAANAALTPEQRQEKRRELALRLVEMKNKREREKFEEDEIKLQLLQKMRALHENNKFQKFQRALQQQHIANLEELDALMKTLQERIERYKERAQQTSTKSKQQIQKEEKIAKPPADVTQEDWLNDMRQKREEILKRKQIRNAQRQEQGKRHTHAAQERMRIISTLARNEKRRKGNDDDDFGMNDDDWDVYKRINRYNDDSDSEAENEKLLEYEKLLNHYDTNFIDAATQAVTESTTAENYQLHFGLEAIRAPEVLFQPSMIGCPEAGLAELIAFVLKLFSTEQQQSMVEHVYLTGGCAKFRGLKERLAKELLEMRPFQSTFGIYQHSEPTIAAWLGACEFAKSSIFKDAAITRAEYEEYGGEYFKEHLASNFYYPTPKDEI